ncbi:MAG: SDR family NAD(P)-dependent oxidoreductase [Alphaproteobacteria bacterium]|nr:SDR family NAD(P)-dependent oxidoreductase [Alphaproteobacteria bacterium]MCB9696789.1 SDR family NAD(P)-dependent oxidoreductase [Alphaproteobacteria bacterium]
MGLLDGRVVLITGAGHGLGRSHALACAAAGAAVVVVDPGGARDGRGASPAADEVAQSIVAKGGQAVACHASVTDPEGCRQMVKLAVATFGRLDAIVNNAGILRDRTFAKMTDEDWHDVLQVHLEGTRLVTRAALPVLLERGGAIVNTTSISGLLGQFGQANYGAAKAAIYGLTRVLSLELEKKGVTVNAVAPIAHTRMTEDLGSVPEDWRPEHVSAVVVYLVSEAARNVTGRVFAVEGPRIHGWVMQRSEGIVSPDGEPFAPEEIGARVDEIFDLERRSLTGRTWAGPVWRCDRSEFTAYADATEDHNPRYRGPAAVAPPMFHVRPMIGLLELLAADPELALDRLRLVHGEHAMTFHGLLRHGDVLRTSGELLSLQDKSSGRVATFAVRGHVGDRLVLDGTTTFFVRAPVRKDQPKTHREPPPEPPPPSFVTEQPVAPDQAVRYAAASGDHNPIHLDEAVAKAAGLPRTILHGLCSMAFAQRDLVDRLGDGDPARLASIAVRWARPVLPGQTLAMRVWDLGGGKIGFATVDDQGRPALTGTAVVR